MPIATLDQPASITHETTAGRPPRSENGRIDPIREDEIVLPCQETPGTIDPPESALCNRSRRQCIRVSRTLAGLTPYYRHRVYQAYRTRGGVGGRLNQNRRALLSEAIFAIENDLEHRRPDHPQVVAMREARNALYDDLGWNE